LQCQPLQQRCRRQQHRRPPGRQLRRQPSPRVAPVVVRRAARASGATSRAKCNATELECCVHSSILQHRQR
jgi:hypothetical protein